MSQIIQIYRQTHQTTRKRELEFKFPFRTFSVLSRIWRMQIGIPFRVIRGQCYFSTVTSVFTELAMKQFSCAA